MSLPMILLLFTVFVAQTNAVIHFELINRNSPTMRQENNIQSVEGTFGPDVPQLGYSGEMFVASPLNTSCTACADFGCRPLAVSPKELSIVLIQRSAHYQNEHDHTDVSCTFDWKVRNAMLAGYGAVVIYNYPGDEDLEQMQSDGNVSDINISSVFVGGSDGQYLQLRIQGDFKALVTIYPDPAFHSFLVTFVIVVASSSIVFTIFLFYRRHMIVSRMVQVKKMSKREVMKLPKRSFKAADAEETCVICLENFVRGDTITTLPCKHIFHKKCITPWLSEQQRVCPICKRDPLQPISETTPLFEQRQQEEQEQEQPSVPVPVADVRLSISEDDDDNADTPLIVNSINQE